MCSDTRGATPVYRCTCAASEIFSNGSRGTPGWENTLNRVPELPNAQLGISIVNSARPMRTLSAGEPGDTPGSGAVPAVIVVLLSAAAPPVSASQELVPQNEHVPRRARPRRQPLTAPAVMPDTIFRLKKMNMISGGTVTSTMFMKSRLYWVLNWLVKL